MMVFYAPHHNRKMTAIPDVFSTGITIYCIMCVYSYFQILSDSGDQSEIEWLVIIDQSQAPLDLGIWLKAHGQELLRWVIMITIDQSFLTDQSALITNVQVPGVATYIPSLAPRSALTVTLPPDSPPDYQEPDTTDNPPTYDPPPPYPGNTGLSLVDTQQCWPLIGWHKSMLASDWLEQVKNYPLRS